MNANDDGPCGGGFDIDVEVLHHRLIIFAFFSSRSFFPISTTLSLSLTVGTVLIAHRTSNGVSFIQDERWCIQKRLELKTVDTFYHAEEAHSVQNKSSHQVRSEWTKHNNNEPVSLGNNAENH